MNTLAKNITQSTEQNSWASYDRNTKWLPVRENKADQKLDDGHQINTITRTFEYGYSRPTQQEVVSEMKSLFRGYHKNSFTELRS